MLLNAVRGFCMALADSVPGVSGGTIAFLLGFYDEFINSLNDMIGKDNTKRKAALIFLIKLGIGWVIGFGASVMVLSSLFQAHIYEISSVFLGLTFSGQWIYVSYILQCLQPRQKVHGDLPVCRLISCRSVPVR